MKIIQEFSIPLIAGVVAAVVWANLNPAGYHYFVESPLPGLGGHVNLHFLMNDVFMALFFAMAAKEITESVLLGGPLNSVSKAINNVAQAMSLLDGLNNPVLVVIGAEIAAGTQTAVDNETWQAPTIRIEAGAELHLRETQRTKGKDTPLTLVAEPTVEVEAVDGDQLTAAVHGWHQFNPVTGQADFVPAAEKNVRMWLLDTDYDGLVFCARRIHLSPKLRDVENRKVLRGVLRANGDPEAVDMVFGYRSQPFPRPESGEIAVRLVLDGGYVLAARETVP